MSIRNKRWKKQQPKKQLLHILNPFQVSRQGVGTFRSHFCAKRKRFLFLGSRLFLVLSLRGNEEVIESALQKIKRGPLLGLLPPARHHDLVQFLWAAVRPRHPVEPVQAPDHLRVGHPWRGKEVGGRLATAVWGLRIVFFLFVMRRETSAGVLVIFSRSRQELKKMLVCWEIFHFPNKAVFREVMTLCKLLLLSKRSDLYLLKPLIYELFKQSLFFSGFYYIRDFFAKKNK